MSNSRRIRIEVHQGDVLEFPADVLALKYAQDLYGADRSVYEKLSDIGNKPDSLPEINAFKLIRTQGAIAAETVLFVGVVPLNHFGYQQIREFGHDVLDSLARLVYLEVGYAWGCGRPTVLLVRDTAELKFDVKGQRCLVYKSIKHLEEVLGRELEALASIQQNNRQAGMA